MTSFFEAFAPSLFESVRVSDHYLFAVHVAAFWTLFALTLVAGVGLMWLANRTQPTPSASHWEHWRLYYRKGDR